MNIKELLGSYTEQVEKADKKGYAEIYKTCADLFFNNFGTDKITFTDIGYLDGYFIFGMGTNAVVHFHIKECPGWKFGIWWNEPNDTKDTVSGQFFAQYEETIDKFKPAASEMTATVWVYYAPSPFIQADSVKDIIRYIRDEPYLAFCRDYFQWDYNLEYHTKEEAKSKYDEWAKRTAHEKFFKRDSTEKILTYVRDKILPLFTNAKILDLGEDAYPRYDIAAPYSKNKKLGIVSGCYNLNEFFDEDEEGYAVMQEFTELIESIRKEASTLRIYWFNSIEPTIRFYKGRLPKIR